MLNAKVEPRLMRQRIPAMIDVRYTELSGTWRLGFICSPLVRSPQSLPDQTRIFLLLTLDIQRENGNPLSREKAHISREVVANAVIFPREIRMKRVIKRANAVAFDPVFLNKTRYGD